MGEHGFDSNNGVNEVTILECRTCLHIMSPDAVMFNIFERWTPPWDGMANTIAEDLEILAKVKVQQLDKHSKVICRTCYELLHSACTFTSIVKRSDQILQQRFPEEQEADKVWPKPIQLEKSFNSCMQEESMNVEIKEEVLSDNEYDDPNSVCENGEGFATLDIKVEPEEMIQQQPSEQFTVNGSLTVNTFGGADLTHLTNGSGEENLLTKIKEEPLNEEEIEPTQANDLPLSCMLCSKDFNCVTGLKPACSNSMADNTMPQNEEASSLLQTKNDTTKWTGAKRGRPKKKKRGRPKSQRSRSEQRREASRKYQRKKAARRKAAAESTVTISEANQKAIATYSAPHSTSVKVDSSNHSEIVKKKNDDYYFRPRDRAALIQIYREKY